MLLQLLIQIFFLLWPLSSSYTLILPKTPPLSKPNCQSSCGNVTIPFPFGIGANCYLNDSFAIDCKSNKPFLNNINLEVLNISLQNFTIRVQHPVSNSCLSNATKVLQGTPFFYSDSNKFTSIACNNVAFMSFSTGYGLRFRGCSSICDARSVARDGECLGIECCQIPVPRDLQSFNMSFDPFHILNNLEGENKQECEHAFLVDPEWFEMKFTYAEEVQNWKKVPVVLKWYIDNSSLDLSRPKHRSSIDCDETALPFLSCHCKTGLAGNPYLLSGCHDTDKCKANASICGPGMYCKIFEGAYNCIPSPTASTKLKVEMIKIGLGTSLGSLILLFGAWRLCIMIKRRNKIKLKKKYFKQNGGLLLQQQLTSFDGSFDKSKLFNSKELDKATDHFNVNRILGQGGQGTVYKGMLTDGRLVAVKKSKVVDEVKLQEFVNEVVILSQINHRNVVKLLGFCLETEVPILVYEFIHNGTLFSYLQEQNEELSFTWDLRLRIATEIAGAISYLHSAASLPIYHRDIKSSNILLDEKYRAKVADFGMSRSIPVDHTHVTTKVHGTFGYFDPEYFRSNQFTDKSDVYSFGVVLVELLTGKKPIFSTVTEAGRSLALCFISSMEENNLYNILDVQVKLAKDEEIMEMANLAVRCLHLHGKQRPAMKEVAMVLEGIRAPHRSDNVQGNVENFAYEGFELAERWNGSTSTSSTFDNR